MPTATTSRKNKHFLLDQTKLRKAQAVLGAKTETETIEIALEKVISETEKNQKALLANENFIKAARRGKFEIIDVFGRLDDVEEK